MKKAHDFGIMTWYATRRIIKNGKVRRLGGRFVPGTRIRLAMKYILRYFSAYKKETVLAPLFKMIEREEDTSFFHKK